MGRSTCAPSGWGYPGVPLVEYTREDLRREFDKPKTCARYCTIACVQIVGLFDNWRSPQAGEPYVSRRLKDSASQAPARVDSLEPQPTQVAR